MESFYVFYDRFNRKVFIMNPDFVTYFVRKGKEKEKTKLEKEKESV